MRSQSRRAKTSFSSLAALDDGDRLQRAAVLADGHAVEDGVVEPLEGAGADEEEVARSPPSPRRRPPRPGRASGTASFSISVSSASCARMPATFGCPPTCERILSTSSTKTRPEAARREQHVDRALGPSCSRARSSSRPSTASPGRPCSRLLAEHVGVDAHDGGAAREHGSEAR